MARRIALIQGHPDPAASHLCHALADAYAEAAKAAGHQVTTIALARLDVPLLSRQEDFHGRAVLPQLAETHGQLLAAEHIVLVFPLWLGTMPALVKAFLEQVIRPAEARPSMGAFRAGCWPAARCASSSPWACRRCSTGCGSAPTAFWG